MYVIVTLEHCTVEFVNYREFTVNFPKLQPLFDVHNVVPIDNNDFLHHNMFVKIIYFLSYKLAASKKYSTHTERTSGPFPQHSDLTPTPDSETTPNTAPHSQTTPSKALKRQPKVSPDAPPPSSSTVRQRHVTPLLTESEPKTEIDSDGISDDPSPSSSVYSTADTCQTREGGESVAGELQGERKRMDKTEEVEKKGNVPYSHSSVADGGGVCEKKAQSYKYDTSTFPVRELRMCTSVYTSVVTVLNFMYVLLYYYAPILYGPLLSWYMIWLLHKILFCGY